MNENELQGLSRDELLALERDLQRAAEEEQARIAYLKKSLAGMQRQRDLKRRGRKR